jgi:multidrug efflux pump subunit AcrA (membrane-fusion protein)
MNGNFGWLRRTLTGPFFGSRVRMRLMLIGGTSAAVTLLVACTQIPQIQFNAVPWPRGSDATETSRAVATPTVAASQSQTAAEGVGTPVTTAAATLPATAPPNRMPILGGVAVKRGPVAEEVPLSGRIVGREEVTLSFLVGGTIKAISAQVGREVREGQVLAELDSRELAKELDAARSRLQTSAIRLQQAQARAQSLARSRQREAELRQREMESRRENAIAEAELALRRAKADFEVLRAGPSAGERSAAEAAVISARASLERVRLEQSRLTRGADPDEIRAAEAELAGAEARLMASQAELDRMMKGAAPEEIRVAELAVERAQIAVRAAHAISSQNTSAASRDASIAAAELGVREAQERLSWIRRGAPEADVEIARRKVDAARFSVDAARQRLERVRKGPDEQTVTAANSAVASAAAALQSAETRLADLNSHPKPNDLQDAEARLASAEAVLERARAEVRLVEGEEALERYDVQIAQNGVDYDRGQVDRLERDLSATQLAAPFAGVIASVLPRTGATIEAGRPVVVLGRAGAPIIQAALLDGDAARLAAGQKAIVQVDGGDGTRLDASVLDLVRGPDGVGTVARIQVSWGNVQPPFGATARARVIVRESEDALLVPRQAVRTVSDRQVVEILDGDGRRIVEVEVGITTAEMIQILSGVDEGQIVVIGS